MTIAHSVSRRHPIREPQTIHATLPPNTRNIAKTGTDHSVPRRHTIRGPQTIQRRVDRAVCPGFRPGATVVRATVQTPALVAHALVRAASTLLSTPGAPAQEAA
jgi:hypothetical protein